MSYKKLTDDAVVQILRLLQEGHPVSSVAKTVGASPDTVLWIALGHSYKHVDRAGYVHGGASGRAGAANPKAKLDEAAVVEMLGMVARGVSCAAVARHYGVSAETVYSIRDGRTWKHVPRT